MRSYNDSRLLRLIANFEGRLDRVSEDCRRRDSIQLEDIGENADLKGRTMDPPEKEELVDQGRRRSYHYKIFQKQRLAQIRTTYSAEERRRKLEMRCRQFEEERKIRRRVMSERRISFFPNSFPVVKSSLDPRKDFILSMTEMIVANDISKWKDLEDLLTCYLCLNSKEHHEIILNVFEEILLKLVGLKIQSNF